MPHRALVAAAVACVIAPLVPLPSAGADPPPAYVPPVDAPVVDPFRPPAGPYGAGNRGLEYGTRPGTEVRAVPGSEREADRGRAPYGAPGAARGAAPSGPAR